MHRLPVLASARPALETCTFCPKLCRAACPVAVVEASETVTPWGLMSLAYYGASGHLPIDADLAATAWACSGCHACTGRCDHHNPVAATLRSVRTAHAAAGRAPAAARAVLEDAPARAVKVEAAARAVGNTPDARLDAGSPVALLVGCTYAVDAPDAARAALRVANHVLGPVRLVTGCCGLPLAEAGRPAPPPSASRAGGARRFVVADPGCAEHLRAEHVAGREPGPAPELLLDVVHAAIGELPRAVGGKPIRYHDPCRLARGLGRVAEPRALLEHVTGRAPLEFGRAGAAVECSGAGGLLPKTRPDSSRALADARIAEHRGGAEGARLVTACGSSLRRFRSRGEPALDLWNVLADALGTTA